MYIVTVHVHVIVSNFLTDAKLLRILNECVYVFFCPLWGMGI